MAAGDRYERQTRYESDRPVKDYTKPSPLDWTHRYADDETQLMAVCPTCRTMHTGNAEDRERLPTQCDHRHRDCADGTVINGRVRNVTT